MFRDRSDAGKQLAGRLGGLRGLDVVVLGLPRGGVPVAAEVARALDAPLDVVLVRKLGVPGHAELAMGAIGEDGVRVLNHDIVRQLGLEPARLAQVEAAERSELDRRATRYRGDRPRIAVADRTAVVVDDGIATGATARAACEVVRAQGAAAVVLAVPVAPPEVLPELRRSADEVLAFSTPSRLIAVGQWYDDFTQVSDEEVVAALAESRC
jgi:putative phosphoribosyl transferase